MVVMLSADVAIRNIDFIQASIDFYILGLRHFYELIANYFSYLDFHLQIEVNSINIKYQTP
jgi:hypothetical protein